jgi:hypothetical protein
MRTLIRKEFERGASIPLVTFPEDGTAIQDSPRLTLVVADPELEWSGNDNLRKQISEWTTLRGASPRLYPGSLVWCDRKPGRDLREKIELWFTDAEVAAKDEVWAGYRFVLLADNGDLSGIRVIDLGAGHSSSTETLCGRVISALKSQALLNESVGAGYIDRNWPPALMESGAWPLTSLRQSFLNGALTRMIDPDGVLRNKIVEFVGRGDFGLASGQKNGSFDRVWFEELIAPDEVVFEPGVFLLKKSKAEALKAKAIEDPMLSPPVVARPERDGDDGRASDIQAETGSSQATSYTLRLTGMIPPELWNRLGTKLIPKLRSGDELTARVEFSVSVSSSQAQTLETELRQILDDLGLNNLRIERQ